MSKSAGITDGLNSEPELPASKGKADMTNRPMRDAMNTASTKWRVFLLCFIMHTTSVGSPSCEAAPQVFLIDEGLGQGSAWIRTDDSGSLAVEIALMTLGDFMLTSVQINSELFDTPNPGDNPFLPGSPVGGDTNGLYLDLDNGHVFAAYGSGVVDAGDHRLLDFDYVVNDLQCGTTGIDAAGAVAQNGSLHSIFSGSGVDEDCSGGDFSGDGRVGNDDLTLLLDNWGQPVPPIPDGWSGLAPSGPRIDNTELTVLLDSWAFATRSVALPEPSSTALVLLALAGCHFRIRK